MRLRQFIASCLLVFTFSFLQNAFAQSQSAIDGKGQKMRVGLALGGGGMRGAAHVGVMKVLLEEGIPIDIIAGTSIGAAVGGFYCAGVPLDELEDQFTETKFIREFMPMPLTVRIILAPIIFLPRLIGYRPYDGLYKGEHCRKYADKLIGTKDCYIENLRTPYAAICTNLLDGKSCRLTEGRLSIAMQASTSVPGIKKPVQIGDCLYCDGGLSCNLPVSHVKAMGADFIIAVDVDETMNNVPLDTFRAPGSVSKRALRIDLYNQDIPACQQADFVIHPNTDGISLISRKKRDEGRAVQAGIEATRQAMPELKRKLANCGIQLANKDISSVNLSPR